MKKPILIITLIIVLLNTLSINVFAEPKIVRVYVDDVLKESTLDDYPKGLDGLARLPLNRALELLGIDYDIEHAQYIFTVNGKEYSIPEGSNYYYLDGERIEMPHPCYKINNTTLLMPIDFYIDCLSAEIKSDEQITNIYFYSSKVKPENEETEGKSDTENTDDIKEDEGIGLISQYKKADIKVIFSSADGIYALDEKTGNAIAIDESFAKRPAWTSIIEKLEPHRYKKLVDIDDNYIYFIDVIHSKNAVESYLYRINKDGTQKILIDFDIDIEQNIFSNENSIFYAKTSYSIDSHGFTKKAKSEGIFELKKGTVEPKKIIDKDYTLKGITGKYLILCEYLSSERRDNIFAYNISEGKLFQLPSYPFYCSFVSAVEGSVYYGNTNSEYYYRYNLTDNKLDKLSKIDPSKVWRRGSDSNFIFYNDKRNDATRTFAYDKRNGTSLMIETQCSKLGLSPDIGDNIKGIGSYNDDFYYYKEVYVYGDSLGNLFNLDKCEIYKSHLGKDEKVLFSVPCMINKMMVVDKRYFTSQAYVKVNGKILDFPDAKPFIDENNRTQVPVRFVSEALGAEVEWDATAKAVKISKENETVIIKIGEKAIDINGVRKEMDTAAIIKNGRTFVPLRFVSEAFGASVEWNSDTNMAVIK
ncbi:MAG TPA: stalk domain-containing protein [Acetivibrio sp.]|uniref:stalk domain-containing protein n=1 Tax=Acetivibrio sp. TaxID=1872092 RepID=UPI002BB6E001|nr:stalk domain-containing protein [Acetivibrio sp.]HOM02359.1 stalk domain-containing protein [Acetivibrio sp.]